jgi:hypothetical protein
MLDSVFATTTTMFHGKLASIIDEIESGAVLSDLVGTEEQLRTHVKINTVTSSLTSIWNRLRYSKQSTSRLRCWVPWSNRSTTLLKHKRQNPNQACVKEKATSSLHLNRSLLLISRKHQRNFAFFATRTPGEPRAPRSILEAHKQRTHHLAVRRDYYFPGCTGSTSIMPCAATTCSRPHGFYVNLAVRLNYSPPSALAPPQHCSAPRLLVSQSHVLYLNLVVRLDYSSPAARALRQPCRVP